MCSSDLFRDEYQEKLKSLVEAKQQGLEVAETEPRRLAPVNDLMEALQKSLASVPKKPPERAAVEETEEEASAEPRKRAVKKGSR